MHRIIEVLKFHLKFLFQQHLLRTKTFTMPAQTMSKDVASRVKDFMNIVNFQNISRMNAKAFVTRIQNAKVIIRSLMVHVAWLPPVLLAKLIVPLVPMVQMVIKETSETGEHWEECVQEIASLMDVMSRIKKVSVKTQISFENRESQF